MGRGATGRRCARGPRYDQILESLVRRSVVQQHVVNIQQSMFCIADRAILLGLVERHVLMYVHSVAVAHDAFAVLAPD